MSHQLTVCGTARCRPGSLPGRALRSVAFALVSTVLAVAAHRLAGGALPGWPAVAVAMAGLGTAGWLLSRRERSGLQLGVLVVLTQAVLHASFTAVPVIRAVRAGSSSTAALAALLLCHHGPGSVSASEVRAAAAGLHLKTPLAPPPSGLAAIGLTPQSVAMLLAHLLAACALAWWLRRGERLAWAAACRVARCLVPATWPATPSGGATPIVRSLWVVLVGMRGASASVRGPPPRRVHIAFA